MAAGTKDDPWQLKTPPLSSDITLWRDEAANPPALVCFASGAELRYHLRAIEDPIGQRTVPPRKRAQQGARQPRIAPAKLLDQRIHVPGKVPAWQRARGGP